MQYFTVDCYYSYNLLNSFLKGAILVNEDFKVKLYSHLRIFIVLRKYFSVSYDFCVSAQYLCLSHLFCLIQSSASFTD